MLIGCSLDRTTVAGHPQCTGQSPLTQLLANKLGENMHDIVFWLQVFSVVPFILAAQAS